MESVRVYFHLISPFFRDHLCVPVDWTFPFLPRIGEGVSGWVWIKEGRWDQAEIERGLTTAGKEHWEHHRKSGFGFDDWLFEFSMECKTVYGITFGKYHDSPPGDLHVDIWVNETGDKNWRPE